LAHICLLHYMYIHVMHVSVRRSFHSPHRRIFMTLHIESKTLSRGLLMSAAILLQTGTALAAESVSDAQSQARDLLSGTVAGRARTPGELAAAAADTARTPAVGAQEQARRLILGAPNFGAIAATRATAATPAAPAAAGDRDRSDPQAAARRMLVGRAADAAAPVSKHRVLLTRGPAS
jgi:hypothetical protein